MVESSSLAPLYAWLVNPLDGEVHNAIEPALRLASKARSAGLAPNASISY